MTRPATDLDLLLLAADALDPERTAELQARLRADPQLAERYRRLHAQEPPDLPERRAWRIPPPGIGLCTQVHLAAALGPRQVRVGSAFQLCVPTPPDPNALGVVVLRAQDEEWVVMVPSSPDRALPLALVGRPDGGTTCIDLVARQPLGLQRWALALPPLPLPQERGEDPWASLRRGIAARRVAVGAVDVEVLPA